MWQCGNITVNHRSRVFVTKYVARLHLFFFFFSPTMRSIESLICHSAFISTSSFFENALGKSKTRKQSLLKNFKVKKVIFWCSQMMITTDNSSTLVLPFYKAPLYFKERWQCSFKLQTAIGGCPSGMYSLLDSLRLRLLSSLE